MVTQFGLNGGFDQCSTGHTGDWINGEIHDGGRQITFRRACREVFQFYRHLGEKGRLGRLEALVSVDVSGSTESTGSTKLTLQLQIPMDHLSKRACYTCWSMSARCHQTNLFGHSQILKTHPVIVAASSAQNIPPETMLKHHQKPHWANDIEKQWKTQVPIWCDNYHLFLSRS